MYVSGGRMPAGFSHFRTGYGAVRGVGRRSEEERQDPVETIYVAGGCFWGVQKYFDQFRGVVGTETGFANGKTEHPTYEQVCYEDTGHAETVKIDFDESVLSLHQLLMDYFRIIDPLSVNRQGYDVGTQYRTGIYYTDDAQRPVIEDVMKIQTEKAGQPLAVEVKRLENYTPADAFHQKYLDRYPAGYCHLRPSLFDIQKVRDRKAREAAEET